MVECLLTGGLTELLRPRDAGLRDGDADLGGLPGKEKLSEFEFDFWGEFRPDLAGECLGELGGSSAARCSGSTGCCVGSENEAWLSEAEVASIRCNKRVPSGFIFLFRFRFLSCARDAE